MKKPKLKIYLSREDMLESMLRSERKLADKLAKALNDYVACTGPAIHGLTFYQGQEALSLYRRSRQKKESSHAR